MKEMSEPVAKRVRYARYARQSKIECDMNIINLDDDSLLKILSYLDCGNLVSAARTCTRMYSLYPSSRPSTLKLELDASWGKNDMQLEMFTLFRGERFPHNSMESLTIMLNKFGSTIRTIYLQSPHLGNFEVQRDYLHLLMNKCSGLKCLKLLWPFRMSNLQPNLLDIWCKLTELHLESTVESIDWNDFFFKCPWPNVKRLNLHSFFGFLDLKTVVAPVLEDVRLVGFDLHNLESFCAGCPKIKSLIIDLCQLPALKCDSVNLVHLESITLIKLRRNLFNIGALGHLKQLKDVHLNGKNIFVDQFVSKVCQRDQLRSLHLENVTIAMESLQLLARMKNLENAFFREAFFDDDQIRALFSNNFKWLVIDLYNAKHLMFKQLILNSPNLKYFSVTNNLKLSLRFIKNVDNINLNKSPLNIKQFLDTFTSYDNYKEDVCHDRMREIF